MYPPTPGVKGGAEDRRVSSNYDLILYTNDTTGHNIITKTH